MARRKKTSPAEDLMDLVAMLPWWVGVVLALVFYVVLHRMASQQVATAAQPGQVVAMLTQTLWKTFASFGQYIPSADLSRGRGHVSLAAAPAADLGGCCFAEQRCRCARWHDLARVRTAGR